MIRDKEKHVKFTPEICDYIVKLRLLGVPIAQICSINTLPSPSSVLAYEHAHSEFMAKMARAVRCSRKRWTKSRSESLNW